MGIIMKFQNKRYDDCLYSIILNVFCYHIKINISDDGDINIIYHSTHFRFYVTHIIKNGHQ
jgi:hypothetical protein